MKQIAILALLIILTYSQTVIPKTQTCSCSQLQSQADCNSKLNCFWTAANSTNPTNSTGSTISPPQGTCSNQTLVLPIISYCQNMTNITNCASTIGCAFLNNTCTIFAGCSAYVQTTNVACQAISTQCTTDGQRCAIPSVCQAYNSQILCSNNIATSGAKSCTWVTGTGSTGTCQDKTCQDAPTSLSTNMQCNAWITGCLTNGKGCVTTLALCSTYTQAAGCTGMIGSDGPCTNNTSGGQSVCRPLVCADAPTTMSTNSACSIFLAGCLTTGKGCIQSLQSCSQYNQNQGCTGLIGSDGPCTTNTSAGSSACRALTCTDAPTSTNTNSACNTFLVGCVTTGQGCINILSTCSSYTGTTTTCNYVGTDGICKGTSTTSAPCAARQCGDAAPTLNTDAACSTFQTGCITNGVGCVQTLGLCSSYQGTNTTCLLYKGSDGNCTAPTSQTTIASCTAKVCSDAPSTITTNLGCQAFSYTCVTNGAGCITPTTCEASALAISCQGNSSCSSNQICLNRSNCANYTTQSICLQNQQQYLSGETTYLRNCVWNSSTCSNTLCNSLSASLTTDIACGTALAGCVSKGAGCVDINDPCSSYQGTTSTCQGFKGVNGTKPCTQLNTVTESTSQCLSRTLCNEAKTHSLSSVTQSSNNTCQTYLQGCFFDGKDNCTNGDCTTYFGTQDQCNSIKTALSGGKPQTCWKTSNLTDGTTACIPKTCAQAIPSVSNLFNTTTLCQAFLSTCVWTGNNAGGCQDASSACTSYVGSLQTCNTFSSSRKACTKQSNICRKTTCTLRTPPSTQMTEKAMFCQAIIDSNGLNCRMGAGSTCDVPVASEETTSGCIGFLAIGADQNAKNTYCFSLKIPGSDTCGYTSGDTNCSSATCSNYAAVGSTADQKFQFCQSLVKIGGFKCALATASSTTCSNQDCSDYGLTEELCIDYVDGSTCRYNQQISICYQTLTDCTAYQIPLSNQGSQMLKAKYCLGMFKKQSAPTDTNLKCSYTGAGNTCAAPVETCSSIALDASLTSNYDKLIICQNQRPKSNTRCTVSSVAGANCEDVGACDTYSPFLAADVSASDATRQLSCQNQIDTNNKPCSYNSATPTKCAVPVNDCTAYNAYGNDQQTNQALCQKYIVETSYVSCAYLTGNTCKEPVCSDVTNASFSNCKAYFSKCLFDGLGCVLRAGCSTYTAQSNGNGKSFNCLALDCTLKNPTDTKCSSKVCSDITSGAAPGFCKNYSKECINQGDKCITFSDCAGYTLEGTNDTEKVNFCNGLVDQESFKCTYISGDTSCQKADDCSTYNIAGFTVSPQIGCNNLKDINGRTCQYIEGQTTCSPFGCNLAPVTAQTDSACQQFLKGCELDIGSACSDKLCSQAANTLTTDDACAQFRFGCVTNGAGCIEIDLPCGNYKGNAITCQAFKGTNASQPCNNTPSAAATDSCINRTCNQNTTAKSNSDCSKWYPSTSNVANCVWNGTLGCVAPQACASFNGTADTCPTYIATDGPCQGTGAISAPCFAYICTSAPATYNTDAQCKSWGQTCITNGFGCITSGTCQSILSPIACPLYKSTLGCDLANQCKTKPNICGLLTTATECNNTPLLGQSTPSCAWNAATSTCGNLTCALLPVTLTTEQACSTQISTCTTNGAGCITKGACSSYPKIACGTASTTDMQKVCIWYNSVCRPIQCTDNTTATSDAECNKYLAGCRSTGVGCAQTFTCQQISLGQLCLQDTTGYPCLWLKPTATSVGTCVNYAKCTDIISSSHSSCQAVSPLCTTNGINCVSITGCSNTIAQASCIIGTDGNCGWLPATGTTAAACALYTNCSAANGTTTAQCLAWGPTCVSNGTACISKTTCSSYTTQTGCGNAGTDGTCFWVAPTGTATTGTCRLQLCSDATTNLTTHTGCVAFAASTACTTSGTACISQSNCSSYLAQAGCVQGTDGVCFWATTTTAATNTTAASNQSACRLKQCTDSLLTLSASCASAITGVKCVSNGVNCITQSTCSTYTAREACIGGGSDGACAFTPGTNTTTPNVGTCALFTQCTNANSDQTACNTRSDACFFNSTTTNGTTTSSCSPHTCATRALGSSCQPVPSWDLSTYQICVLTGTACALGSPSLLTAQSCYSNSVMTYSWNQTTSTCGPCMSQQQNNLTNNNTNLTNTYGNLISLFTALALIF